MTTQENIVHIPFADNKGRPIKGRSYIQYLATIDINETRAELDRLLGPVPNPIPNIPVGTFVAHDHFGFGETFEPVREGGRAGHKVEVLFDGEDETRIILLSYLEIEDVTAADADAERERLIAKRVNQPKKKAIKVALPPKQERVEFQDDEDDSNVPDWFQAELEELS